MERRRGQTSFACFSFLSFFRGGSATGTTAGGVGGGGEGSEGRAPCEACWRTEGRNADSDANMKDGDDQQSKYWGLCTISRQNKEGAYHARCCDCGTRADVIACLASATNTHQSAPACSYHTPHSGQPTCSQRVVSGLTTSATATSCILSLAVNAGSDT